MQLEAVDGMVDDLLFHNVGVQIVAALGVVEVADEPTPRLAERDRQVLGVRTGPLAAGRIPVERLESQPRAKPRARGVGPALPEQLDAGLGQREAGGDAQML